MDNEFNVSRISNAFLVYSGNVHTAYPDEKSLKEAFDTWIKRQMK